MYLITSFLALFFLFASSIKIAGWHRFIFETQLKFFKKYGLNRSHMIVIGVIELLASLLLLSSFVLESDMNRAFGSVGIFLTSLGAIYFHLIYDTVKDAIPAITTLTLSAVLLFDNNWITAVFEI
ncbi:DoxX family protein [Psychrobium sp. MM17-31]|uniref:DoxX family protein n=1 Tax=Psychrobium sp. MM17-31 TaxID=2917758 RepID=UPI001EF4574A|nr:DoxX family protein [Psychrobium sp. MM17-31]MCG7529993.1 DoxX family protein [Psychrobium sp. MM17-31]